MPSPSNAERISGATFTPEDRLFFDTNVWMLLLGVQADPNDREVAIYSLAYKRILKANCLILTDSLLLAEFANAALHQRHRLAIRFSEAPENFKEYRECDLYEYDVEAVCDWIKDIRSKSQVLSLEPPDDWVALDASLKRGLRDFNDEMIVLQCKRHNAQLITNDRDFLGAEISILTERHNYFRR